VSAKGLQKTYYSTEARVVRYYENIRLVYEIESRVRDLRRAATPDKQENSMNCANHVESPAVAYCRTCGKPMCSNCMRDVRGVLYCEECLASQVSGTMPPPPGPGAPLPGAVPPVTEGSPGLAAILGFIPGVGAFYNGEYAKGFIHV